MAKLLAFCGSTRKESFNRKLLDAAIRAARDQGADVTSVSLDDFPMPIYNGDLEAESGLPEGARRLKELMQQHTGIIIGCPEYNGFMTPLLMNTIDWCSRSDDAGADLSPFRDKPVLITSASPCPFGGSRSATHLRTMLAGMGCIVLPYTISLSNAGNAFSDAGSVKDDKFQSRIDRSVSGFLRFVAGPED
ncbi:MAG: NAD(P)H-dependent oxidoreductase [Pseudomonadales bacterium]|nr:NAD(P)H-dependent oxidoreductase [Pseudomonadales bacterium]